MTDTLTTPDHHVEGVECVGGDTVCDYRRIHG
ncbi:hypothetical protein FB470_000583 [Amycolatopsis thermophila]|uniref:Uncharacterized protein n=1 Tax=Amycolatopsis thermophila TaxID=206084 RepID=A0ABU0EMT8_9PSEU|nr:hypothetical protein [Amycolatopsis thermophila]